MSADARGGGSKELWNLSITGVSVNNYFGIYSVEVISTKNIYMLEWLLDKVEEN